MSRRWKPRIVSEGRPTLRRRRSRFSWREIRLTVLGGMLIGLASTQSWPGFERLPGDLGGGPAAAHAGPVRVIDGDTFDYGGMRVRVADIDTPEARGRCAYETRLAARATARMRDLLNAGPFELHRVDRDEDRYGRKLRIVTRGGRSLGDALVAEGLARTWTGRREPWC
jgi:endonuclease YncB( thermonuclease family)